MALKYRINKRINAIQNNKEQFIMQAILKGVGQYAERKTADKNLKYIS